MLTATVVARLQSAERFDVPDVFTNRLNQRRHFWSQLHISHHGCIRCRKSLNSAIGVAARLVGRYAPRVRRQFLQRLLIALLLVGRLIMGEFAHGMAHDMTLHSEGAASTAETQPCPDHAAGEDRSMPAGDIADHGDASHDLSCCESGSCECACVHVSAIANPSLAVELVVIDGSGDSALADGRLLGRPFALFRPPA